MVCKHKWVCYLRGKHHINRGYDGYHCTKCSAEKIERGYQTEYYRGEFVGLFKHLQLYYTREHL